jgi:hypothetical protein
LPAGSDLDRAFHIGSGHLAAAAVPIVSKYLQRMVGGDCGDMAIMSRHA